MKKIGVLVVIGMVVLIGCKSSAGSTSSTTSGSKSTSTENSSAVPNTEKKAAESQQAMPPITNPNGVSTKSPTSNPSTPVKKYPPSGN